MQVDTKMAELGVPPHVADMILNHAIKDAPKSRQPYDVHHYIPEKRKALTIKRTLTWICSRHLPTARIPLVEPAVRPD